MDLNKLTKAELLEMLETYGVKATLRARKATLVELLEEKMNNMPDIEVTIDPDNAFLQEVKARRHNITRDTLLLAGFFTIVVVGILLTLAQELTMRREVIDYGEVINWGLAGMGKTSRRAVEAV